MANQATLVGQKMDTESDQWCSIAFPWTKEYSELRHPWVTVRKWLDVSAHAFYDFQICEVNDTGSRSTPQYNSCTHLPMAGDDLYPVEHKLIEDKVASDKILTVL